MRCNLPGFLVSFILRWLGKGYTGHDNYADGCCVISQFYNRQLAIEWGIFDNPIGGILILRQHGQPRVQFRRITMMIGPSIHIDIICEECERWLVVQQSRRERAIPHTRTPDVAVNFGNIVH